MWQTVTGLLGSLFRRGHIQAGKANQAVTGSTTGDHSPILTTYGDIHLTVSDTERFNGSEEEALSDLEETMPSVLEDFRNVVAKHPDVRDFLVTPQRTDQFFWGSEHFVLNEEDWPGIRSKVVVLLNHGLISELYPRLVYRLGEPLIKYLTMSAS
jgi:hypothetical protein